MSRSQLDRSSAGRDQPRGDDTGCNILHIDMDAFFASVELRDRPELQNQPVIIGHSGGRGVVLSATYPARKLGVHSAMPMSRALRVAPSATVIEPSHSKYSQVSRNVMEIFSSITPVFQPLSIDEAFLDVSGAIRTLGNPAKIGDLLRARVYDEQGITCSVGVASTMFVAKLATNYAKPDGLHVVPANQVIEFLHPLPVTSLWGVGEKTAQQLNQLGLRTIGDIANTPVTTLVRALGQALGTHLFELSWGRDPRKVEPLVVEQSISNEQTFGSDLDDHEKVLAEILALSEKVASRLRKAGFVGKTVSIKVRFADFSTITRSKTLKTHTDVAKEIYATAKSLYEGLHLQRVRIRLVGVKVDGLQDEGQSIQQLAFGKREHGWREAEQVADLAKAKFGPSALKPARLINPKDRPEM